MVIPFSKTGIIFDIFNRSGKTSVEKERLIKYTSGFANIFWLTFIIYVWMLFGPSWVDFFLVCWFWKEWIDYWIFQVVLVVWICMNNFYIDVFSSCHEVVIKAISQDFGARFYFTIYFYRLNLFFFEFSCSIPCSFVIIFVFLKKRLVKICLIDSCKFVT